MKFLKYIMLVSAVVIFAFTFSGCGGSNWDSGSETETEVTNPSNAKYEEFSQARYDSLLGQQAFVLYFHADWCSTCKALKANLQKDLSTLPNNTIVLEGSFDDLTDLKKKYGVVSQTTLVVLDAKGEVVETLANPNKAQFISAVEKSMNMASSETAKVEEKAEEKKEESKEEAPAEETKEETVEVSSAELDAPVFTAYSAAKAAELKGQPHAIFFHADWCHVCRNIEGKLNNTISTFPKGTKILEANFDKEVALRKELGVPVQSVIVVLDASGNVQEKLMNPSMTELKASIEKSLG